MNTTYNKAYEVYKNLSWWINDPFDLLFQMHIKAVFEQKFNNDLKSEFKRMFPKKKKVDLTKLPEELIEEIRTKWITRAEAYAKQKIKQEVLLNKWLNIHAPMVTLSDDWQITFFQEFGRYSTQTNKEGYALGDIKRKAEILEKYGIPYEIRKYFHNENYDKVFVN